MYVRCEVENGVGLWQPKDSLSCEAETSRETTGAINVKRRFPQAVFLATCVMLRQAEVMGQFFVPSLNIFLGRLEGSSLQTQPGSQRHGSRLPSSA